MQEVPLHSSYPYLQSKWDAECKACLQGYSNAAAQALTGAVSQGAPANAAAQAVAQVGPVNLLAVHLPLTWPADTPSHLGFTAATYRTEDSWRRSQVANAVFVAFYAAYHIEKSPAAAVFMCARLGSER